MQQARLTARQEQVVARVARGLTNKEIAAELGISERAVKAHVSDLLRKFEVPNRAGLIAQMVDRSRPQHSLELDAGQFARYDEVPFMVAVTHGAEHRFVFVNAMSASVAGRPATSLVGLAMKDAYPDLDPRYLAALDAVYATGVPWSAPRSPARFPRADGTFHDTLLNLMFAPIRGANGRIIGLLHIGAEVEPDES